MNRDAKIQNIRGYKNGYLSKIVFFFHQQDSRQGLSEPFRGNDGLLYVLFFIIVARRRWCLPFGPPWRHGEATFDADSRRPILPTKCHWTWPSSVMNDRGVPIHLGRTPEKPKNNP